MLTLGEIISAAMQTAEATTKIASVQQSASAPDTYDQELAAELGLLRTEDVKVASAPSTPAPVSTKVATAAVIDEANHGLKVAAALRSAANVVIKLAQAETPVASASAPAAATRRDPVASSAAKPIPSTVDGEGELNNEPSDTAGTPATNNPGVAKTAELEALVELAESKIAEYKVVVSLGMTDAAEKLASEVHEIHESIKQAQALETSGSSAFAGGVAPTNEQAASLTKAQARDRSTREVNSLLKETVKQDPAVGAALGRTDGLKVSSLTELVRAKQASSATGEDKHEKTMGRLAGGAGATHGAILGGLLGGAGAEAATHAYAKRVTHGPTTASGVRAASGVGRALSKRSVPAGIALGALGLGAAGYAGGKKLRQIGVEEERRVGRRILGKDGE